MHPNTPHPIHNILKIKEQSVFSSSNLFKISSSSPCSFKTGLITFVEDDNVEVEDDVEDVIVLEVEFDVVVVNLIVVVVVLVLNSIVVVEIETVVVLVELCSVMLIESFPPSRLQYVSTRLLISVSL